MVNNFFCWHRMLSAFVLVCFLAVSLSGCTTLRRKFVRKNKNKDQKEAFIPVLDPVEYKRVETSAIDAYRSHYAMAKAYFTDSYAAFGSPDSTEKREKYLISQISAHLRGMAVLLRDDRKAAAERAAGDLEVLLPELDKPKGIRRYDIIKGAVHKVEMDVRRTLKPDMVKEFLVVK